MKTISTFTAFTSFTSFTAPSHPAHLPSFWSAVTEQALAIALLAVLAVVIFFMAIGVASMVLELTRALTMAGPFGLAALAMMAAAGMRAYAPSRTTRA